MQFWQQLDLNVFRTIHLGWHSSFLDLLFLVITYTGIGQVQLGANLLVFAVPKSRVFALPMLVVWLLSGLVNTIIKHSIERGRPSLLEWALPQEPHKHSSFPSGHTVTSFAIAFLLVIYLWPTRWRWPSFGLVLWALLVGISRVYRGVHWPTDVLGAMGLGLASACFTAYLLPLNRKTLQDGSLGQTDHSVAI